MSVSETIDRVFARLLWVSPQPQPESEGTAGDNLPAERAFSLSLVISALRCTLQYMVLPIALPLIGLTTSASLPLVILLDVLAIVLLVRSLRYFWRIRHPRRFDMLPLSAVIFLIICGSLGFDLWQLLT